MCRRESGDPAGEGSAAYGGILAVFVRPEILSLIGKSLYHITMICRLSFNTCSC